MPQPLQFQIFLINVLRWEGFARTGCPQPVFPGIGRQHQLIRDLANLPAVFQYHADCLRLEL